ncbi:hypothetical protein [Micromonospora sp. NPDC049679]|uniref:hypothetical protein n=1 Tax=Micromonospora sp. NPDC049679 TaxID=3155920 RepID=UPI0033CEB36D
MTDTSLPGLAWTPAACTLPTAQQPLRLAEFDALFATAIEQAERISDRRLRLTMTDAPDLEARVRDLAARESDCCAFFTFTITAPQSDRVVLDVEVPVGHIDVLDAVADRAATVRGDAR